MSEAGFLAEAKILVRPDTTGFKAELEAALKAVTATPITIPVVAAVSSTNVAVAAQTSVAASAQAAGAAAAKAAVETANLAAASTKAAVSVGSLSAAMTAEAAASTALNQAMNGVFVSTQRVAVAMEEEAAVVTGLTARLQAYVASLGEVAAANAVAFRGAGSSALALLKVRGATLAASGEFLAGAAAVTLFAKAVKSAADLQTELNVFRVTAGATADEMSRVSDEAKQLGRDLTLPGVTAGDAAVAMTELAKAGLSVEDSLAGARGALQLATAAQIDNVTATKLVAGALNSFQLAGNEAVKVADLLTGAANASQGEISDMGTALAQASAVAHLFGVSVGDTVTLLTELAKAGISGGRAGTSLRVAFLRLVNPPAAAAKALKELNVQIRDAQGNLRPEIFSDITKALQGYTKAQQQAKLATIFGSDAIRAAAIIGAQGATGFQTISDQINQYGLAQRQAAARTQGLQGSFENLSNQASALGLTIGQLASGPVGALVKSYAEVLKETNDVIAGEIKLAAELKNLGGSAAGAIPFIDKLGISLHDVGEAFLFINPATRTLKILSVVADQFGSDAAKIKASATDVRAQILSIVKAGEKTGGDLGLNQALVSLDLLAAKFNKGGPAAQKFASEIADVRTKLQQQGTSGFKIFPDNVEDLFPPDLRSGAAATKVGTTLKDAFRDAIPGVEIFSFTKAAFDNVSAAIEVSGKTAADTARKVFAGVVAASQEQIAKISEQFDIASVGGSRQGQLAALKNQAAEQQKLIDAADAAAKAIGAGNKGFATAVAKRRAAEHELAGLTDQIKGINDQIASDATKAAADAKASRDKANQAFLNALGGRETDLQNSVLAAASTKSLNDDINRNKALRGFYVSARKQAEKTITDAKLRLQTVQALTKDIIAINKTISDLVAQQVQAQQENQQKQRENIVQGFNLNIAFDQETKNTKKETADRLALIRELEKQLKLLRKGSNAYKEIRNEIVAQAVALDEITKAQNKKNQSSLFASAAFDFLQAQQGFASNLFGNLIPGTATGGLVGGGSGPVQQALPPLAGAAEAAARSGPTSGQAQSTNHILNQILQQLKQLNGRASAPEAHQWQAWQNATFDGVGGG